MKDQHENITNTDVDESLYEDWEFDYTNNMVEEFLEEKIIPELDRFDFENKDENYVPGVASFTLFTRMIETLIETGWSKEELKQAIDDFGNIPDIVH